MDERLRLRGARRRLRSDVTKKRRYGYRRSQELGRPISVGGGPEDLSASDFFHDISIDPRISERISQAVELRSGCSTLSLGQLIDDAKTIRRGKQWISRTERFLREQSIDENDVFSVDVKNAELDYLADLYHCLVVIDILIRESKRVQRSKGDYFLEYCALCWRLVNKNKILNWADSTDYSASYCLHHHPKKADWRYHGARSALLSAIRKADRESNDELESREREGRLKPRYFYKMTARFADKPPNMIWDYYYSGDSWEERANRLVAVSNAYYPIAAKLVTSIPIDEISSWQEWFYIVICKLDPTGADLESWKDVGDGWEKMSDDEAAVSPLVGERVLLNIIHRYESFCTIRSMARPRGPKKGEVEKNNALRRAIVRLATEQKNGKNKVNGAQIAREVNVSRQRVSVILRELGLR